MSLHRERGERAGWDALTLDDGALRVTVLPQRGAELHELVHVASGVDLLFHAPWGLQPPGAPPRGGSDGHLFLERYAGGWQELFPNANDPCLVDGVALPFHGEVAGLEWQHEQLDDGVLLTVESRLMPLRLERAMRLDGSGALRLEERVTNRGEATARFVWGHHLVLGAPFIAAGCRLETSARSLATIAEMWEDSARLEPGQRSAWPHARLRGGGTVDLREVPGPESASHDDVYLDDLAGGWAEVTSPPTELRLRLDWDPAVFGAIIVWQPYGGARALPLQGSYALGVEPWSSPGNLEQALASGRALELGPGATLATALTATMSAIDGAH